MTSAFQAGSLVRMAGQAYDPISLRITKDNAWSPTYQGECVLATSDIVAPSLSGATNLFTNPSAAIDLTGATSTGLASFVRQVSSVIGSAHGTAYRLNGSSSSADTFMNIGGDSGAIRNGMAPGLTYTASGTLYLDGALGGAADASGRARRIVVYVATATTGLAVFAQSDQAPNAQGQNRLSVTFTLPANTTIAFIRFYHGHAGTSTAYWTDLMLVQGNGLEPDGTTPIEFFDGDFISSTLYNYKWNGTRHQSTSTRTVAFTSTSTTPVIDPRLYPKIRASLYYGSLFTPVVDVALIVRTYAIDDVEDTVTLTLASDEVKLQDYKNVGDDFALGAVTIPDMVAFAMRKIGVSMGLVQAWPGSTAALSATATIWKSGQSLDEWLLGAIRSQGYELFHNPKIGILTPWQFYPLTAAGKDSAQGVVNAKWGANILQSGHGVDMDSDEYGDALVVAYNWTDAAGAAQRKTYYSRPNGAFHKVKTVTYPKADPGNGQASADSMRALAARSGWTSRLVLIAQPGYRNDGGVGDAPSLGNNVYIQRRDGSPWVATISRVTYSFPEDTLELGITNLQPDPSGNPNTTIPIPGS